MSYTLIANDRSSAMIAAPSSKTISSNAEAEQGPFFYRGLMLALPVSVGFWVGVYYLVRALT